MTEIDLLKLQVESALGQNAALFAAIKALYACPEPGSKRVASLATLLELGRVQLQNSTASDMRLEAYDLLSQLLLAQLGQSPQSTPLAPP